MSEKMKSCREKIKSLTEEENNHKGERLEYDKVMIHSCFKMFWLFQHLKLVWAFLFGVAGFKLSSLNYMIMR